MQTFIWLCRVRYVRTLCVMLWWPGQLTGSASLGHVRKRLMGGWQEGSRWLHQLLLRTDSGFRTSQLSLARVSLVLSGPFRSFLMSDLELVLTWLYLEEETIWSLVGKGTHCVIYYRTFQPAIHGLKLCIFWTPREWSLKPRRKIMYPDSPEQSYLLQRYRLINFWITKKNKWKILLK